MDSERENVKRKRSTLNNRSVTGVEEKVILYNSVQPWSFVRVLKVFYFSGFDNLDRTFLLLTFYFTLYTKLVGPSVSGRVTRSFSR